MESNAEAAVNALTSAIGAGAALAVLGSVLLAYALRAAFVGRRSERRIESETFLLGPWFMEAFYWVIRVPARVCVSLGVRPDTLTYGSLVMSVGVLLAASLGHFFSAGFLLLCAALLDALDGVVARESRVCSNAGEILDAVVDRYADAAPLAGLVVFYRFSIWQMAAPMAALLGGMMVSYVRAKSEAMGLRLPSGLMRRHERIAHLCLALMIGPALSPFLKNPWGIVHPAMLVLLVLVALLSNVAAIQLASRARRALRQKACGCGGGTT